MRVTATIRNVVAGIVLAALVVFAFGGALECGFVRFDDHGYVYENPAVSAGLTKAGVRWAFTTGHMFNWHPLTWLSHMADVELYGLGPAGHHLTSLLLHAANAALLFFALWKMTGRFALSWIAAALWATHPLRAESVVWISERKDVLAMFFGLLALAAYARRSNRGRMGWVVAWFALSLLSKPMWVTLPFLLLLLDIWPLRRWPEGAVWRLVKEKWPLFLLTALSCAATYIAQHAGGAVQSFADYPVGVRLANAAVAYVQYVRTLCWPFGLSVFYPHPGTDLSAVEIGGAAMVLLSMAALSIWTSRRSPWWMMGCLWFMGSLVPMIGLVQVGWQARADRYTYLPHIGLIVAMVWGVAESARSDKFHRLRTMGLLLAIGLVIGLALLSRRQTAIWRDSQTLFRHAITLREDNALAHYHLATLLAKDGRYAEAIPHFRIAVRTYPEGPDVLNNMAWALASDPASTPGQLQEAFSLARRAMDNSAAPDASLMDTLALTQAACGDFTAAVATARKAQALAEQAGNAALGGNIRTRLRNYEASRDGLPRE